MLHMSTIHYMMDGKTKGLQGDERDVEYLAAEKEGQSCRSVGSQENAKRHECLLALRAFVR